MQNSTFVRDAQERYTYMCQNFDPDPIIAYAIQHGYTPNMYSGQHAFKGLFQWLACHDIESYHPVHLAALQGPMHKMHQAFVLNSVPYAHFCQMYMGEFVHLLNVSSPEEDRFVRQTGWLEETTNLLTEVFSDDLMAGLMLWPRQQFDDKIKIVAVSVLDRDALKYRQITDLVPTVPKQEHFAPCYGRRGMAVS